MIYPRDRYQRDDEGDTPRGATFDRDLDGPRTATQLAAVRRVMASGGWWTLARLREVLASEGIASSEAGVSARIRDLRKPEHGSREVERRRVAGGLHEYRLVPQVGLPLWAEREGRAAS